MGLNDIMSGGSEIVMGKRILIHDFHNLLFRTLHVAYNMDPLDEDFVNWKYLMLNSFFYSVKKFKPDQLIIAIDQGSSWRKTLYKDYKAGRAEGREESAIDFEKFFKVCEDFITGLEKTLTNVYFLRKYSYEADDIIAILTKKLATHNDVINISTDKDFYQLYKYKGYKQYNPIKKQFIKVLNAKLELEIKLLTGDKSDNIPQVKPRMGIVSATKYADKLNELWSDKENGKTWYKQYIINKQLIDFDMIPQEMQLEVNRMYEEYDFKKYNSRSAYDYFSKNGMPKVISYIQEFNAAMSKLKSFDELK